MLRVVLRRSRASRSVACLACVRRVVSSLTTSLSLQVTEIVSAYFKANPDATVMVSRLDEAAGNAKVRAF